MASLISRRLSYRLFASSRSSSLYSPSRPLNSAAKPSFQASTANTTQKPGILAPSFVRSAPFSTFRGQSESPDNGSSEDLSPFVRALLENQHAPTSMWRTQSDASVSEKQEFVLFLKRQFGDAGTEQPDFFSLGIPELTSAAAALSTTQIVWGAFIPIDSTMTFGASAVYFWMAIELYFFLQKTNSLNMEMEGDLPLILGEARSAAHKMLVGFILLDLVCVGTLIRVDQTIFLDESLFSIMLGYPFIVLMLTLHIKSEVSKLLLSKSHLPRNWTEKQEVRRKVVNSVLHIRLAFQGVFALALMQPLSHLIIASYSNIL